MNIFLVRPGTRNIGNDIIAHATSNLIYEVFGTDTTIVNIPSLKSAEFGGLVAQQVYDMNKLADGIVIGGGNLFENGQLTYEAGALSALTRPLIMIGLSHGRIAGRDGSYERRTDSLGDAIIRHLFSAATVGLVRDRASRDLLQGMGIDAAIGGCPTLFLPKNPISYRDDGPILISVRHPSRMSVPPSLKWRVADDLRDMIASLQAEFGNRVKLICHDYIDIEFAAGFSEAPSIYYDDVYRYIEALRNCSLSVSYRLHAFLPCVAFGVPSIHLSYDERGRAMVETIGLQDWNVDLLTTKNFLADVMGKVRARASFEGSLAAARPAISALRGISIDGLQQLRSQITKNRPSGIH